MYVSCDTDKDSREIETQFILLLASGTKKGEYPKIWERIIFSGAGSVEKCGLISQL